MKFKNAQANKDQSRIGEELLNHFEVKEIRPEEKLHMISEAAYYLAEHRYFQGGCQKGDWFEAQIEIDKLLATDPHLRGPQ